MTVAARIEPPRRTGDRGRHSGLLRIGRCVALILFACSGPACRRDEPALPTEVRLAPVGFDVQTPAGTADAAEPAKAAVPETALPAETNSPESMQNAPDAAADPAQSQALQYTFAPETLDVYRDTRVTLQVTALPAALQRRTDLVFRWVFDDGDVPQSGAVCEHLFRGGMRDQNVTLQVLAGDEVLAARSRRIPLERLPVVPFDETQPEPLTADLSASAPNRAIPDPPPAGETSFRLVVISDSNGPYGNIPQGNGVAPAIDRMIRDVHPGLVVHNGDMVAGQTRGLSSAHLEAMWQAYDRAVLVPLQEAGIPLLPVAGNHDAAPGLPDRAHFVRHWRDPQCAPALPFIDSRQYPLAYTFVYGGVFFMVIDGAIGRVSDADLRWMRQQLAAANIFPLRLVFSHLPLHKFTERAFGGLGQIGEQDGGRPTAASAASEDEFPTHLDKNFRLYNLFLEQNVTVMFSGHYEVYFKGRYGALRVVSTGNIGGTSRALTDQDWHQPMSFVVVDVEQGGLKRVFAIEGPRFDKVFDESRLPQQVEVYRYEDF